jgi:NAD(P)-dependent dehydrogenase (short-subunit alcohol dehydrogenase family)
VGAGGSQAPRLRSTYSTLVSKIAPDLDARRTSPGARADRDGASEFDFIFGVSTKGVLFTVQAALPHLTAGSTVVVIGSTASIQALRGMSLYGGSNAAVRQFVRAWIQEVKGRGIRINVLSPGAVDTPSLRIALEGSAGADLVNAKVKEMGDGNPVGRLADPRELGRAAVFSAARPRASSPASNCSVTAAWPRLDESRLRAHGRGWTSLGRAARRAGQAGVRWS